MKGEGLARHHFWGEYAQTIALRFANPACAAVAREKLNAAIPEAKARWNIPEKAPFCVSVFASGADLDAITAALESFGADANKISSLRFSIDHGEFFSVEISEGEQTAFAFAEEGRKA